VTEEGESNDSSSNDGEWPQLLSHSGSLLLRIVNEEQGNE
jgi:hypothetical protein